MLSIGAGYLRAEFRALGVDFDERNELFDEALEVIRGVWTTDEFAFEGPAFHRRAVSGQPQAGRASRSGSAATASSPAAGSRRGDGWNPFPAPPCWRHDETPARDRR